MDKSELLRGFCERVRALRGRYLLSVEQLALLIDLEPKFLHQMEMGVLPREVDAHHLFRLSEVFGMSPEELLRGSGWSPES